MSDSAQHPLRLVAEEQLSEFAVLSLIGQGAFGIVWKCQPRTDTAAASGSIRAIKQIDLRVTPVKNLHAEIVAMMLLSQRSDNIVKLHKYEISSTHDYLVMEYCSGGDLRRYLDAGEALSFMHAEGIIHRDVKPNNILFFQSESDEEVDLLSCTAKLADFGVATMADHASSPDYGTPDYMAPEVIQTLVHKRRLQRGRSWRKMFRPVNPTYDFKCDMFSLGAVMYECASGKVPFKRAADILAQDTELLASIANGSAQQSYDRPSNCSTELCDAIQHLLVVDASKRMTADAFLRHAWFNICYVGSRWKPQLKETSHVLDRELQTSTEPSTSTGGTSGSLPSLTLIDPEDITLLQRIGIGFRSEVFRGLYAKGGKQRMVAVKSVSSGNYDSDEVMNELCLISSLTHPSLVRIAGHYWDSVADTLCIVMQLMEGGDLSAFLCNKDNKLTVWTAMRYVVQLVDGMVYLSSQHIIHRDLAASNCLLGKHYRHLKIGDFGLCRRSDASDTYIAHPSEAVPFRRLAPECFDISEGIWFSQATDVWAFGIVVWEIFSREFPFDDMSVHDVQSYPSAGRRLEIPDACPEEM